MSPHPQTPPSPTPTLKDFDSILLYLGICFQQYLNSYVWEPLVKATNESG